MKLLKADESVCQKTCDTNLCNTEVDLETFDYTTTTTTTTPATTLGASSTVPSFLLLLSIASVFN